MTLNNWDLIQQQYKNLFAIGLIQLGALAYISLIGATAIMLERKAQVRDEAKIQFKESYGLWWDELSGKNPGGAVANGQGAPAIHDSVTEKEQSEYSETETQSHKEQESQGTSNAESSSSSKDQTFEWPEPPKEEPIYTPPGPSSQQTEEEVPVYGGKPGEHIKFSEAVKDPSTYYIDEAKRVWRRDFMNSTYENHEPSAEAA